MTSGNNNGRNLPQSADGLKNWIMVVLTLLFVSLYAAALLGWLKPLGDDKMVVRLEPIIFVIIGYYFGRLPGQQNERALKDEISRQTQRADAAQQAKEQALQTTEALEEKIKNTKAALVSTSSAITTTSGDFLKPGVAIQEDGLRHVVTAAVRILNS